MADRYAQVEALIRDEPPSDRDDQAAMTSGLHRLCGAATRALDALGVGLTVVSGDGSRGVSAASDQAVERLQELQLTVGEGPCFDVYRLQRPVLVPDLALRSMTRWPAYTPAVYALGVRAVFSFPLQIGAARLGTLDVFRAKAGMLTRAQLQLALTFAEVAMATLLDRQQAHPVAAPDDDGAGDVLGSRTELYQAQGMVMVQLGVSPVEAMVRLRAHAYAQDRRLAEVAAEVVARRLVFTPDPPAHKARNDEPLDG